MTPNERAREIAEAIFAEWQASCARYPEGYPSPMGPIVERHIAAALTIPHGHVRDEHGVDRKVLGTLPLTEDGCVCGIGGTIYINSIVQKQVVACEVRDVRFGWLTSPVCYSTREAALAAKVGGA